MTEAKIRKAAKKYWADFEKWTDDTINDDCDYREAEKQFNQQWIKNNADLYHILRNVNISEYY